jgi:glycerol transport system ATP-binding protein
MGIRVEGISKYYSGKAALQDVSLDLEDGSFVTLLGETGAGKTSLLRIMCGIERPDKGRVSYDGRDVTNLAVQKRDVAMVYQEFVNYPSMTLYENIASPLRIAKTKHSKQDIDRRVRQNAELLGLSSVLDHYPEEVSGGQKQRTAIARALAKDSKFIFLDEPLANLDYKLREELRGELKTILSRKGGLVVYATPEAVDALSMSTHVAYLEGGHLYQFGTLEEVYRTPASMEVGAYFSYPTMNIMPAQVERDQGRTWLRVSTEISVEANSFSERLQEDQYLMGLRAYNLYTRQIKENMVHFRATVELSEELGSDTELHIRHHGLRFVVLMQEVVKYPPGTEIDIFLDPTRIFLFSVTDHSFILKTFEE